MMIIALKDVQSGLLRLYEERWCGGDETPPYDIVWNVLDRFVRNHYRSYAKESPKQFIVYYKAPDISAWAMTVSLVVRDFIVEKSVMGSREPPLTIIYPYFLDTGDPINIPLTEFPPEPSFEDWRTLDLSLD